MVYHTHQDRPYWYESAYYLLTDEDVERLENATNELHQMALQLVDEVVQRGDYDLFCLTEFSKKAVERSWRDGHASLYGRFDLAYDGLGPPKLLEYNADTPTSLLEAAVVQWQWLQAVAPGGDQFNSIWEALVSRWQQLKVTGAVGSVVHFGHEESVEDLMTVCLLRDAAEEAGITTIGLHMGEIGWSTESFRFVDLENQPIQSLFKLYPWEILAREPFGDRALAHVSETRWLEPAWKMLLSNKVLLAELWRRHPGHPNLLPAVLEGPGSLADYVRKPIFSREGANVSVVQGGMGLESTGGEYGAEGFVYQALAPIPDFGGNRPVIGSWVVGDESCGIGIRESDGWITQDTSRFVPHCLG